MARLLACASLGHNLIWNCSYFLMVKPSNSLLDNRLPNAMVDFLPGSSRTSEKLEHGWRIRRPDGQLASGYVSDNADGNNVEFALNQDRLPELPIERPALLRWLQYQRQRLGGRPYNVHQRGCPVSWFRIGFATMDEAISFLREFNAQHRQTDVRKRWHTPEGFIGDIQQVTPEHSGNRNNDELAMACIPILISHVLEQRDGIMQPLTYEELAERLDRRKHNGKLNGLPMALGMGDVLARSLVHIDRAAALLEEELPYLTTIVVDKSGPGKGLPGDGVACLWPDFPGLSRKEKTDRVELEYMRIMDFGRHWLDVLHVLELPDESTQHKAPDSVTSGGLAGGESPQHRALKEYIASHPELVKAPADAKRFCEFALRSADAIDVLFKSPQSWVGVEVKASTSEGNQRDYERGLYQIVKYRAVLEAQARIDHPIQPPQVHVVLALEMALPDALRPIAKALDITMLEHVGEIPEFAIAKNKRRSAPTKFTV
ncbi:hypothetical protein [Janthinobacterium sp. SUN033]|uniref:hypothetical protein n=1 Tax=Janthinobacterium sp. SUN033 TaxID=3002439 RepID=UPI0025B0A748|nr:hypothetical protein [Janthinobacterium sp. SUN033]MDN2677667.1 hypothetical protein [Janthinobacterium sp. SUN033]